ncbi:Lipopolysaccharide biosynthesis protein, LPS:glycosyltransferase [Collimonas sp. OK607]|uniref:glycosyltransferase family 8 protein n=1 Tax=Collimonas sp. OK607 TaxID=1798194 RepID=UPI0008EACD51|nr:glycosyltransferase [Collimonas sp. OK607]SFA80331.1 Lipopolysaccharide biosynthesis protein, LPS:glycosyltransferase [Collimonas sp. OK607]
MSAISSCTPASDTILNPAVMHVAFGVDTNYFRGMGVNITSVIKNNPDMDFIFHVFAFSITDDNRRRLAQLESSFNTSIKIHVLDSDILSEFSQFPCFSQHSLGTFVRLLIPNLLRGITQKVLYLDADILCMGKLEELSSVEMTGCIAAVVQDEIQTTVKTQVAALNLKNPEYFNAGVMYIDVDNWIANDSQNKALTILSMQELRFADQDALNIILNGYTKYIDKKWNFRYHLVDFLSKGGTTLNVTEPVVFMHFTGPVKPWQDWCLHEAKSIFIEYQLMSSWADMPLDQPKSVKELKLFSKFLIKQDRVIEGIGWHIKYLWKKFIQYFKSRAKA